nr:TonB-dependent receptor [uncultured Roseateles sp.]
MTSKFHPSGLRCCMALSTLALATSALAAPQDNSLPAVMVTATRSPMNLSQVLADVTVLTRADIERQALGGLADLLRTQACFEMVRNGGPGSNTSLFVRGADTRHTVLLVDGVRVDSQATGGVNWQTIPLAQIERVEIVRGAASAIYGSDAIGGVVQIFTRKGEGAPQFEFGAGIGNMGLAKLDASVSGKSGMLDYALSLAGERGTGFNARPVLNDPTYTPDIDGHRSHSATARLGAQVSAEHRFEVVAMKSFIWSQYDGAAKPKVDDQNFNQMQALRGSWSAQFTPNWHSEVSVGESKDRYETAPSVYLTETRIRNYAWNNSFKIGPGQLNTLLERREDLLLNTGLTQSPKAGEADRHQNAVAAGYIWEAGPLGLQAHLRHDRDSQFGGANTGTLAAGYSLSPAWRVIGSAGTAFRAPTLYQSFSPYGPDATKGGTPLLAERGRNTELGLQYKAGSNEFGLTAYRNLINNLIIFGSAGTCNSQFGCYQNVGQARLQGLTLRAGTRVAEVRLSGTLDLQAPKDVTDTPNYASYGKLLARRSNKHASLRADTELWGWSLGAQTLISGRRFDNAANTVKLGGYALLNLDAQYSLTPTLRLQLQLDNAFDRAYQTANGYASQPRAVFAGLRYTPKF